LHVSRSPVLLAVALLTTFVAGVIAGVCFAGAANTTGDDVPPGAKSSATSSKDSNWSGHELEEFGLKNHAADVDRQLADMKAKEDAAILSDRLAFYKKYNLAPTSFSDDLKVTDEMAEFLKMSAAERKNLEDHLEQIHAQIQSLEKQHLKLVSQADNSVTYEIEPFSEGAALKDQLKQFVEGDLGTDRGDLFMNSAVWEMNRDFAAFGVGKTGLQLTRVDQSGPPSYRITETFANGSSMTQGSGNILPSEFRGLVQLDTSSP
jgi:hypothetical protein